MIRNSDIDRLRGLFAKRLIATMDMLKKTVGTVADLTVFRKLRELDYCTSYSHRGRFYTLRELAEFDENGLWWIRSVGFSSRGTLVATAEGLVNASEAGYAVEELDAIVRVGTKDVLPKLAWEKRLRRTRIRNRNVYFSPKRSIREQQIASRRVWEAQPSVSKSIAAQDVLPDELKAAIILFFSLLDERERRVYAGLESLKLGYGGDRQMAEILGLDVSTVARGRRELLEHDVNVERVRKAGAGGVVAPLWLRAKSAYGGGRGMFEHEVSQALPVQAREAEEVPRSQLGGIQRRAAPPGRFDSLV